MKSIFFLILVTVIWGTTFPIFKIALPGVSPFVFNGLRFLVAGLISLLFTKKPAIKTGIILGIVIGFGYLAQTWGITLTTASKSGFITSLYIVIVPFFSYMIEKQKVSKVQIVGFPLAFLGSYLLSGGIEGFNTGDLLNLLCAFCFALHVVLITHLSKEKEPKDLLAFQFLTAAAINFIAGLGQSWSMPAFTLRVVFYAAVFPSIIALFIQMKYQKKVGSNTTALIFVGEPIFAMIFSFLFIGEKMNTIQIIGGGILIFSILLASLEKKKKIIPIKEY